MMVKIVFAEFWNFQFLFTPNPKTSDFGPKMLRNKKNDIYRYNILLLNYGTSI